LSIKTKLIAGAGSLTLAAGALAFAAPAANAAVVTIGTCQNLLAQGTAKSSAINPDTGKAFGITDGDNRDGAVGAKGVDPNTLKGTTLGSCSFPSNVTQGVPDAGKPVGVWPSGTHTVTKWGTKLYSREFDCNTADGENGPETWDKTEWPLAGTISLTFQDTNNTLKANAISASVIVDGFKDPNPNNAPTPADLSDVVQFHGLVTKGAALGADVSGETEFDPTIKDKAAVYPGGGAYFGYSFDIGGAVGCTDGVGGSPAKATANILTFNNGSVGGVSQLLGIPVSGITFTKGAA